MLSIPTLLIRRDTSLLQIPLEPFVLSTLKRGGVEQEEIVRMCIIPRLRVVG